MKSYFFTLTFSLAILSFVSCDHNEVGLIADPYDPEIPERNECLPRPIIPDIQFQHIESESSQIEIAPDAYELVQLAFQSLSTEELTILDSISTHLELTLGSNEIDKWNLKRDSLVDSIYDEDAEFTKVSQKMNDLFSGDDWLKNYLIIINPAVFESFEVEALVQGDSLLSLAYIDTIGSDCVAVWYEWGLQQFECYQKIYAAQKHVIDSVYQFRNDDFSDHRYALVDSIYQDYQYHINQAINYWVSLDFKLKVLENTNSSLFTSLSAFNNTLLASNYFRIKNLRENSFEQLELEYEKRAEDLEVKYLNIIYSVQGKFNQVVERINELMLENAEDC
jgi:hypothetical protein